MARRRAPGEVEEKGAARNRDSGAEETERGLAREGASNRSEKRSPLVSSLRGRDSGENTEKADGDEADEAQADADDSRVVSSSVSEEGNNSNGKRGAVETSESADLSPSRLSPSSSLVPSIASPLVSSSSLSSLSPSVYDASPFAPFACDVSLSRRGDRSSSDPSSVHSSSGGLSASRHLSSPRLSSAPAHGSPSLSSLHKDAAAASMARTPFPPYKVFPAEERTADERCLLPSENPRLDVPLLSPPAGSEISVSQPRSPHAACFYSWRRAGAPAPGGGEASHAATPNSFQIPKSRPAVSQAASRVRRLQVLEIARGTCRRHLLQTSELLRLVHSHNRRGVVEDAAVGALKLRDLRQVIGRCAAQRPSVELRRNCVLVNLPYVKCILLCSRILLLSSDTESAPNHPPSSLHVSHGSPKFFSFSRVFSQAPLGSASPFASHPSSSLPSSSLPSSSSSHSFFRPPALRPRESASSLLEEDGAWSVRARHRCGAQGSATAVGGEGTPAVAEEPLLLAEREEGRREEQAKRRGRGGGVREQRQGKTARRCGENEAANEGGDNREREEQARSRSRREWTEDCLAWTPKLEDETVSSAESPAEECGFFWGEEKDENEHKLLTKLVRLSAASGDAGDGPFEFVALEAILVHVCDALKSELEPISLASTNLLRFIHEQPSSTRKLRKVGDLRRRLGCVRDKARGIDQALRELLDSEDDLRRLQVSRFWEHEKEWERPSRNAHAEEVEILLECYQQEIDALLQSILRRDEALDDALQLMELHLASIRNAFLKSELALDIIGVLFSGIAAFAGLFGMNIRSGWEEEENAFWAISLVVAVLSLATVVLVYIWFKRQKL
ncbi:CorA family Mg2+ transporter protein [Toxoplasma gondii ME49]|uniref:CorA family Mg2+ transporter protein n=1 Tax=Toxoplasma gondii (strain ATCC 50611 / Me49) TaxID=508771 RepID=S8EYG0_TOXGM|nr:CorA family Mg2+ transporter protein [Toxoplasma gondii ME49]EPT27372.1 CorA family Mg2+ transporter protein [Toxoplasma gondii ME49]|eukprot:XP_002370312.1 CorA family Mg2+ transporter protein [Toxoplasma gondii ME49]